MRIFLSLFIYYNCYFNNNYILLSERNYIYDDNCTVSGTFGRLTLPSTKPHLQYEGELIQIVRMFKFHVSLLIIKFK